MKKIHVTVKVDLFIKADDDADLQEVINEMEYNFTDTTGEADIEDTEVLSYEVTDSR